MRKRVWEAGGLLGISFMIFLICVAVSSGYKIISRNQVE